MFSSQNNLNKEKNDGQNIFMNNPYGNPINNGNIFKSSNSGQFGLNSQN